MKDKDPPKPPEDEVVPIPPVTDPVTNAWGRELIHRVEQGDQAGAMGLMKRAFPEPPEPPKLRPVHAEVKVPIEAINGTSSIGATLLISSDADEFVTLEIDGKRVSVRLDQLAIALQSLGMLKPLTRYGVAPLLAGCSPPRF